MRTRGLCVLALAMAAPLHAGDAPKAKVEPIEQLMTMRVEGDIAVDDTGKVMAYHVDTALEPAMRAMIDKAVATWSFLPPTVDGKAAKAKSDMRITLAGRKVDAGYEVSIDNVVFYDAAQEDLALKRAIPADAPLPKDPPVEMSIVEMKPKIKYPRGFHVNGRVNVQMLINLDGTLAQAQVSQCSLYFAKGLEVQLRRACQTMEDNILAAVRTWKFKVDTHGRTPTPADLTGTLPVDYLMQGDDARIIASGEPGQWRVEARTRYREGEWLRDERFAQRVGTSDAKGNEWLPTNSRLKFREGSGPERAL